MQLHSTDILGVDSPQTPDDVFSSDPYNRHTRKHSKSSHSSIAAMGSPCSRLYRLSCARDALVKLSYQNSLSPPNPHPLSNTLPPDICLQRQNDNFSTQTDPNPDSTVEDFATRASAYSRRFPRSHLLNSSFVDSYRLGDELGAGEFGFVMTARHRNLGHEVAVKFIIKAKVHKNGWVEDEYMGRVPIEVMLLSSLDHDNIVKCFDVFEDDLYFYLVQELHGTPWPKAHSGPSVEAPMPSSSFPVDSTDVIEKPTSTQQPPHLDTFIVSQKIAHPESSRPRYHRRPSHDLFECIEQSPHQRLSEDQARYVFTQIVDAVYYLDQHGVTHRDIKDENLVIDKNLHVKLIDFGSATIDDPAQLRPFHRKFFGTEAYAAPEILLKKPYQDQPVEIWTLGILLSCLLTGGSPFGTWRDTVNGRITFEAKHEGCLSVLCLDLLRRCLEPDPRRRPNIQEVKMHPWLTSHPTV